MVAVLPDGVLLVDKPVGVSSFDVIRGLRYATQHDDAALSATMQEYVARFGPKLKIGHAGTLDPLASGLMVLGVGPGTKHMRECVGLDKVYDAVVCVGEASATGDAEGPITSTVAVPDIADDKFARVLASMVGVLRLQVSGYSAMKQGGEPLYKKMRRGEQPVLPVRDMEVMDAQFVASERRGENQNSLYVAVRFVVGSGTYVRSLAEEFGKRLGYPARLENLRRTQVGQWCVEDARAVT